MNLIRPLIVVAAALIVLGVVPGARAASLSTSVASGNAPGPSSTFSEVEASAACGPGLLAGGGTRLAQTTQTVTHNGIHIDGSFPSPDGTAQGPDGELGPTHWVAAGGSGGAVPTDAQTLAYGVCIQAGPTATQVVVASTPGPSLTFQMNRVTATCPSGTRLLSGGARTTPGTVGSLKPNSSFPSDGAGTPALAGVNPTSWTVTGLNGGGGDQSNTTYAFAICATAGPALTVTVVHATVPGPAPASTPAQATASCPAGAALLGGGGSISDAFGLPGSQGDHLTGSYPSDTGGTPVGSGVADSWTAASHTGGAASGSLTQTDVWAMCASPASAPAPVAGPVAPVETAPPSISGSPALGRTLTEVHGSWSIAPSSFAYRWLRCSYRGSGCASIAGADRRTYRPTAADIGSRIRVQETASDSAGRSAPAVSAASAAVRAHRVRTGEIRNALARQIVPTGRERHIATMLVRGGTVLAFTGLEAGRAVVGWYLPGAKSILAARGALTFPGARATTIDVRLTAAGRRALNGAQRLRLIAHGAFTPKGTAPIQVIRPFVVTRGPAGRGPSVPFSTPLVGSAPGEAVAVAVDHAGDTYLAGETSSANFPTAHPLQGRRNGTGESAFVAKLDPAGTLVYATYLGGSLDTAARGIAVDARGDAFVTGVTNSANFPTTRGALQRSYGGGPFDAFVTKLNPTGSKLVYSTFLGDTHYDEGNAIAVDDQGQAVVTGKTVSPHFPRVHDLAPATTSGAFVTRLDRSGSRVLSSSVFGGTGPGNHADSGFAIALDPRGNTYVTGETNDPGFPTVRPLQGALAGGGNAFVIKLNAASTRVLYATFLGGAGNDIGRGIAADDAGDAYVTGQTTSRNFPTRRPLQPANRAAAPTGANAFVTKIDPGGHALLYSTYLGGRTDDGAFGIAVGRSRTVYVVGQTSSSDFPVLKPVQRTLHGAGDAFVTELDGAGSAIAFSTYFGGRGSDAGLAAALDPTGALHLTGQTSSPDFPRRGHPHGPSPHPTTGDGAFVAVVRAR